MEDNNNSYQGSTDVILLNCSLKQPFARVVVLAMVAVATAWALSPDNALEMHKPNETLKLDVSAKQAIVYEMGIPLKNAIQCQQYVARILPSIGSTEVYRIPLASDTYFVIASGPTQTEGWFKNWMLVLGQKSQRVREVSRLSIDGSWNPRPTFYTADGRALIIVEVNGEEFSYYEVVEFEKQKLAHLGDIRIDQYVNGRSLTEIGNLLDGADVRSVDGQYEIKLTSLVKRGWAPSESAVTFRFSRK